MCNYFILSGWEERTHKLTYELIHKALTFLKILSTIFYFMKFFFMEHDFTIFILTIYPPPLHKVTLVSFFFHGKVL